MLFSGIENAMNLLSITYYNGDKNMKKILLIMLIAVFILMAGTASAAIIDLNYSNTGVIGTFATVELSQTDLETFHFDVKVTAGDIFMRNFYFNTDIAGLTTANIINISGASPAYSAVVNYDSISADGFGKYDISIRKNGQHNVSELTFDLINVGAGRTVNDFIQLSADPAGNGYGHFAAQILASGLSADTFYARDGGTPVPEPGTLLLLGSGILGLGLFGRQKLRK
jgi:hypothetical protein